MNALLPPNPTWKQRVASVAGRLLFALALAGVGALAGRALAVNPAWRVSEVDFVGLSRAPEAELRHLSDLRSGSHLLRADLDRAVAGVSRHPWVRSASARRVYPGAVEITVEEYQPVMMLALDRLWYVDETGVPFSPATSADLDFPVLTGLDPAQAESDPELGRAVIAGALRVLDAWNDRALAPGSDLTAGAAISEVHFSASHGYDLVLRSGTRLILGFGDPAVPLGRLDRLVAGGADLERPQRVDLDLETVAVATPLPAILAAPTSATTSTSSTPTESSPTVLPSPASSSPAAPGSQGGPASGGKSND